MKSLSKYAFINAKIRARLSFFLKTSDWENLKTCVAFDDFRNKLSGTRYESVFGDRGSQISLSLYEDKLDSILASDYSFVLKNTTNAVSQFVLLIQLSQQIYFFKRILRNFMQGNRDYKHALSEAYFDDSIMQSDTLAQLASKIRDPFFYEPLFASLKDIKIQKNTFLFEMRLDKNYLDKMWAFTENMSDVDRVITCDFLKLKTDIFNIKTIYRLRNYLKITGGDIEKFLVRPYGKLDKNMVGLLYDEVDVMKIILSIFGKHIPMSSFAAIGENKKQNENFLFQIDVFLNTVLIEMAKNKLTRNPFSVSVLWLFFLLTEAEVNNIRYIMRSVSFKNTDNFLSSVLIESGR